MSSRSAFAKADYGKGNGQVRSAARGFVAQMGPAQSQRKTFTSSHQSSKNLPCSDQTGKLLSLLGATILTSVYFLNDIYPKFTLSTNIIKV